ncbi:MAG: phage major capsid protein [Firmicutes bacterium]|nr:phage major capsid protein [Bacillota bacterium]
MRVVELRQQRKILANIAKEILDAAEAEKRELTAEERERFDGLQATIDQLNAEIQKLEAEEERAKKLAAKEAGLAIDPPVGDAVRALRPNERMTDYLLRERRDLLPDGIRPEELSLGRLIRGLVVGDWKGAEAEKRAMATTPDSLGGVLVPHPLSARIIDLARAKAQVIEAGGLSVPMDSSTLKFAKVLSDASATWKAENAPITESDMTFGSIELKAKTLPALVRCSVELLEDAANLSSVVETSLAQVLGLALDKAALMGSGTDPEPLGLYNASGVNKIDMGANGAALTDYSPFSRAVQAVLEANGIPVAVLYAPRTAGELDRLVDSTGQPLQAPESFRNLKKYPTTQIPTNLTKGTATNASFAVVGDFSQILIGMRTTITIEVSREGGDAFKNLQVLIRAYLRADVAIARPNHFCIIDGIIPPA